MRRCAAAASMGSRAPCGIGGVRVVAAPESQAERQRAEKGAAAPAVLE